MESRLGLEFDLLGKMARREVDHCQYCLEHCNPEEDHTLHTWAELCGCPSQVHWVCMHKMVRHCCCYTHLEFLQNDEYHPTCPLCGTEMNDEELDELLQQCEERHGPVFIIDGAQLTDTESEPADNDHDMADVGVRHDLPQKPHGIHVYCCNNFVDWCPYYATNADGTHQLVEEFHCIECQASPRQVFFLFDCKL